MERRRSIKTFFRILGQEQTEAPPQYLNYLEESLLRFNDNESKFTAGNVYDVYAEINRLSDAEGKPLVNLMDVMRAYEENASRFTESQRDHFIHSVNVFLLGIQVFVDNRGFRDAFSDDGSPNTFDNVYERFLYAWGHASLFHDIGYPIEIAANQVKSFVRTIERIGSNADETVAGSSVLIHRMEGLSEISGDPDLDLFRVLSERIAGAFGLEAERVLETVRGFNRTMCSGQFVDHGFYSALIFIRSMAKTMNVPGGNPDRFRGEATDAAASILLHNFYRGVLTSDRFGYGLGPMRMSDFPLAYLLILCDELQDWNREKYGVKTRSAVYPDNSRISFKNEVMTVNYHTVDERVGDGFVRDKDTLLRRLLEIGDLYSDLVITYSCDRSADYLLDDIRGSDHGVLPRPMMQNMEGIARTIHQEYNRKRRLEHPDEPLEYPTWEGLPQDLKYSNMMQAMDIPRKLESVGCRIEADDGTGLESFDPAEVLVMAMMEHDRWVEERVSNGWIWGPQKDVERRTSPYIAGWDEIPEEIQKYDIEAVENIIPLLRLSGLMVVRND